MAGLITGWPLQMVMVHIFPLLGSFLSGFMVASRWLWLGAAGKASISFGGLQVSKGWGDGGGICCCRCMVVHDFLGFTMGQLALLVNSISSAHFLSVCFLHYECFWSIYCRVAGWQGPWCAGCQANLGCMLWEICSWVALWSCPCCHTRLGMAVSVPCSSGLLCILCTGDQVC